MTQVGKRAREPGPDKEEASESLREAVKDVNHNVVSLLLDKYDKANEESLHFRDHWETSVKRFIARQKDYVSLRLNELTTEKRYELSNLTQQASVAHLETSAVDAANSVLDRLTALQSFNNYASRMLEGEQDRNRTLLEDLSLFLHSVLEQVTGLLEKSLQAEVEVASRNVLVARLQAAYTFEQCRHKNYTTEINVLMQIVKLLADKSKEVNSAVEELAKVKEHVRLLENQLDLNGIVAAQLPADFKPSKRTKEVAPPPEALLRVAPTHYALRVLEHKDMSISDLVKSWVDQERRIQDTEARCEALELSAKEVQQRATVVHQHYLEEKERRERSDRRITEMVKERLLPRGESDVMKHLSELRWNYDQLMDDSVKLAVSLKLSKEELEAANEKVEQQAQLIKQLQTDAETDEIANTISHLRKMYEQNIASLQNDFITAETNRAVLAHVAETENGNTLKATEALQIANDNCVDMERALASLSESSHMKEKRFKEERDAITRQLEEQTRLHKETAESVRSMLDEMDVFRRSSEQQDSSFFSHYAQKIGELADTFRPLAAAPRALETLKEERTAMANRIQTSQANKLMRSALLDGLEHATEFCRTAEQQRQDLVNASIGDYNYANYLMARGEQLTSENKSLRSKLDESLALIDRHSLTVLENNLHHAVSMEDTVNIEEATARIAQLQDRNVALEDICKVNMGELSAVKERCEELQRELVESNRTCGVLKETVDSLSRALETSHTRENDVRQENLGYQRKLSSLSQTDLNLDLTDESATFQTLLDGFQEKIASLTDQVSHICNANAEEGFEKNEELEMKLLKTGLPGLVSIVQETFARAKLLRSSLSSQSLRNTLRLSDIALEEAESSPEVEQALEHRRLEEEVQRLREENEKGKSHATELEARNRKMLDMCKTLSESVSKLKAENASLQTQLAPPVVVPPPMEEPQNTNSSPIETNEAMPETVAAEAPAPSNTIETGDPTVTQPCDTTKAPAEEDGGAIEEGEKQDAQPDSEPHAEEEPNVIEPPASGIEETEEEPENQTEDAEAPQPDGAENPFDDAEGQ